MLYPHLNDLVACKERAYGYVHPQFRSAKTSVRGNYRSPFRGPGLECDSVREYVAGDDIRNIDWRVTARMGSAHVKMFKEERERHVMLCIDMNEGMRFGTKNTFKSIQAARAASLLGWIGIANQDRLSAYLYGDVPTGMYYFQPKRSRKSYYSILQMLAAPTTERHRISLATQLQQIALVVPAGALIYLISDFMEMNRESSIEPILRKLKKKCDIVCISINDRAEQTMYPMGKIGFCAKENETTYVNTMSISGREMYAMQWKENRKYLHDITSMEKIPLVEMTTESNIQQELLVALQKIGRRRN